MSQLPKTPYLIQKEKQNARNLATFIALIIAFILVGYTVYQYYNFKTLRCTAITPQTPTRTCWIATESQMRAMGLYHNN